MRAVFTPAALCALLACLCAPAWPESTGILLGSDDGGITKRVLKTEADGRLIVDMTGELDPKVGSLAKGRIPRWGTTSLQNSVLFSTNTKIGVGTTNPTARLDVAGGVRFGNETAATTCNASLEGTQRYNSVSKRMEYCNGTAWTILGRKSVMVFTAGGTWTKPAGVQSIRVRVVGAGGGGGGSNATYYGGGGASGGYCESLIPSPANSYPVTVGTGGPGGAAGGASGQPGTASSFGGMTGSGGDGGIGATLHSGSAFGGSASGCQIISPGTDGDPYTGFGGSSRLGGTGWVDLNGTAYSHAYGGGGSASNMLSSAGAAGADGVVIVEMMQ